MMSLLAGTTGATFSLSSVDSLRMLVASPRIDAVVSALNQVMGHSDFRALTIRPLARLLVGEGWKSVRRVRAWCPACFLEATRASQAIYDRLLWAFAQVEQCHKHDLRLMLTCPACGVPQRIYRPGTPLDHCAYCANSLVPPAERWNLSDRPHHTELELESVLGWIAANPSSEFRHDVIRALLNQCPREAARAIKTAKIRPHVARRWCGPPSGALTVSALLDLSSGLQISLLDLLRFPERVRVQGQLFEA